jgi:hypothetical protein
MKILLLDLSKMSKKLSILDFFAFFRPLDPNCGHQQFNTQFVCFLKNCACFFCARLFRIEIKNNFVEENLSIQLPFFSEKTRFENSTKTVVPLSSLSFSLPHMEYERSIGLVSIKMKKNYCRFSSFRTFYG